MTTRVFRFVCLLWLVGAGAGHAGGPWRASEGNTSGWAYMTPKERLEHQAAVRAFTTYDACHAYQLRRHEAMEARARSAGQTLQTDRRDICEHLLPPPAKP